MEMTVRNFQRHVDQLAGAFDVTIVYDDRLSRHTAAALVLAEEHLNYLERMCGLAGTKVIYAPPITDETGYVVVMHEMGHHLAPNGMSFAKEPAPGCHPRELFEYFAKKLIAEEAAWEWCRYYVEQVFEWTVAMEQTKQIAFATYQQARRTGGR